MRPEVLSPQRTAHTAPPEALSAAEAALVKLGRWLRESGYHFVTVTPETHRRVTGRHQGVEAKNLRDVFGWSLPFRPRLLPESFLDALETAGALSWEGKLLRSGVRYSTADDFIFVHSAYPTLATDAVFFGPDTYRFIKLIKRVLAEHGRRHEIHRILDLGCGCGVGGLVAASLLDDETHLTLADISPAALSHARINTALAGHPQTECVQSDSLDSVDGRFDLIVSNPPYLADAAGRSYRDGGGDTGSGLSLRFLRDALPRLGGGGTLVLYTGSAIVDGEDRLQQALIDCLRDQAATYRYEELDPDVFGEELSTPAYAGIERIAAVALIVRKGLQ